MQHMNCNFVWNAEMWFKFSQIYTQGKHWYIWFHFNIECTYCSSLHLLMDEFHFSFYPHISPLMESLEHQSPNLSNMSETLQAANWSNNTHHFHIKNPLESYRLLLHSFKNWPSQLVISAPSSSTPESASSSSPATKTKLASGDILLSS